MIVRIKINTDNVFKYRNHHQNLISYCPDFNAFFAICAGTYLCTRRIVIFTFAGHWLSKNLIRKYFTTISDQRYILLRILWRYLNLIDKTKTSNCIQEDKPQRFIWNNKLEILPTEALEKESRSIKLEDSDKLNK